MAPKNKKYAPTVSDLHMIMNKPGIDSNNHKDMANAINTQWRHQGGAWGHLHPQLEALPTYPSQKKKWPKSAIFWKVLNFCPLRIAFCPLDAPKNLVPPLLISKFVSVSSHIEALDISSLPAYFPVDDTPPSLHPWEIYKELKAIKSSKASGPDDIPPKLIKEFAYELSSPLIVVLNCSFREGVVPHKWNLLLLFPSLINIPPPLTKWDLYHWLIFLPRLLKALLLSGWFRTFRTL